MDCNEWLRSTNENLWYNYKEHDPMSIENRAHNQAQEWTDPAISWAVEQELIRFGNEQRKIDIEKACEWLDYNFCVGGVSSYDSLEEVKNEFRKAMEQ